MNHYQRILIGLLTVATAMSCIHPPYPDQLWLQHSPTVLFILALAVLPRWWPLSNASVTCLVAFFLLHALGARYIYSYVPYDDWSQFLLGFRLTDRFHWTRNHYDRLVHFFFGALWLLPSWEVSTKYFHVPRRAAYFYAVTMVLAMSTLYELFEWSLTMVLGSDDVEAYNGQQGDMWDSQKDVTLALIGALVALCILVVVHFRADRRIKNE